VKKWILFSIVRRSRNGSFFFRRVAGRWWRKAGRRDLLPGAFSAVEDGGLAIGQTLANDSSVSGTCRHRQPRPSRPLRRFGSCRCSPRTWLCWSGSFVGGFLEQRQGDGPADRPRKISGCTVTPRSRMQIRHKIVEKQSRVRRKINGLGMWRERRHKIGHVDPRCRTIKIHSSPPFLFE